jgi:hypothetical protein
MRVADIARRFCGNVILLDLHNGSKPDLPTPTLICKPRSRIPPSYYKPSPS